MSFDPKRLTHATLSIDGVDLPVSICDAQMPWSGFDPAEPGSDRTVFWPPQPITATFKTTEEVAGDFKRFIDSALDECAKDAAFDPWADTYRLNDLGRKPSRERDRAEFECRFVMRGTPLVVTKAQAKELEAIEFDQTLYEVADEPLDFIVTGGRGRGALQYTGHQTYQSMAALMPHVELVKPQFSSANKGGQDRLRDRWGRLKR